MSVRRALVQLREVKVAGSPDEGMIFEGYGAVFGNVDSYGDTIKKGAFKRSLREAKSSGIWPSMLSQHGAWGMTSEDLTPIGAYEELSEDDTGLKLKGVLAKTTRGIEMYELMGMKPRPAINGLSIGYIPREWKINDKRTDQSEPRRTLLDVDLIEISPVTFPANTLARVTNVKGDLSPRALERVLRDAGYSKADSKRIIACGLHDEDDDEERRDAGDSIDGLVQIRDALRALHV